MRKGPEIYYYNNPLLMYSYNSCANLNALDALSDFILRYMIN